MKEKWLKFVLKLTNKIHNKKQDILNYQGVGVIFSVLSLFFNELFLSLISLPLYLGVRPEKVTAFFEESGSYEKVSFDYSLRRLLTLASASVVFLIWFIKLIIIVFTPNIAGPLNLYSISDLEPAEILESDLVISGTQIQTARVFDVMQKPKVTEIKKGRKGRYVFNGLGQPGTKIVLFLSDKQTAIYTADISNKGEWQVDYTRSDFKLSEGNHAVIAFCYDEKSGGRSQLSDQQYFKVKTTLVGKIFSNIDIFLNISLIIIIVLGIFLIVLTV